ncbi:putative acyl-CoA thioesterase [Corynebacterium xerosis]|nr:putative acyl-CoA thioesterase [Corynebacterium xerosis]
MLRSGFWKRLTAQGWYPVVAGQSITYRKSLVLWQKFDIASRVLGHDDRWIYMEQVFRVGDVVYADAIIRARFLRRTGGSVSIPEVLDLVGSVPPDMDVPAWVTEWNEASSQHSREL